MFPSLIKNFMAMPRMTLLIVHKDLCMIKKGTEFGLNRSDYIGRQICCSMTRLKVADAVPNSVEFVVVG